MTNRCRVPIWIVMFAWASETIVQAQYPSSIYVPRQISYNPIFENALTYNTFIDDIITYIFAVKPFYMQSVGSKFDSYFTICHDCSLNVQENGSGNISSLWFNVIGPTGTFYSSNLSFSPKKQTYGGLIYFAAQLHDRVYVTVNTAAIHTRTDMKLCESNIKNKGTTNGYQTIAQSFANTDRLYGRVCGAFGKSGFDDIQLKLIYTPVAINRFYWDVYFLGGIPTGAGSKAVNLFEPLVGSQHGQVGLGTNFEWIMRRWDRVEWTLQGELKYRYGLRGQEYRSFDLKQNGQWSRYMLLATQQAPYTSYPAINTLTFKADVTPRSSFDLYLATHVSYNTVWDFELGYDVWYRSQEHVSLGCNTTLPTVGVADLLGIVHQNPISASTANISQGVQSGSNQMKSDAVFTTVTLNDINLCSGAQPQSISNSFYASAAYCYNKPHYIFLFGASVGCEIGSSEATPSNVMGWLNVDFHF